MRYDMKCLNHSVSIQLLEENFVIQIEAQYDEFWSYQKKKNMCVYGPPTDPNFLPRL